MFMFMKTPLLHLGLATQLTWLKKLYDLSQNYTFKVMLTFRSNVLLTHSSTLALNPHIPACPCPWLYHCPRPVMRWHHGGWQRSGAVACSSQQSQQRTLTHTLPVLLPKQRAWWSELRHLAHRTLQKTHRGHMDINYSVRGSHQSWVWQSLISLQHRNQKQETETYNRIINYIKKCILEIDIKK